MDNKLGVDHVEHLVRTMARTGVWIAKAKHPDSPGGTKIKGTEYLSFPYIAWITVATNLKVTGEEVLDLVNDEMPTLIEAVKDEVGDLPEEKIKGFVLRVAVDAGKIVDGIWDTVDAVKELKG